MVPALAADSDVEASARAVGRACCGTVVDCGVCTGVEIVCFVVVVIRGAAAVAMPVEVCDVMRIRDRVRPCGISVRRGP